LACQFRLNPAEIEPVVGEHIFEGRRVVEKPRKYEPGGLAASEPEFQNALGLGAHDKRAHQIGVIGVDLDEIVDRLRRVRQH
jgi:hypothetical protein